MRLNLSRLIFVWACFALSACAGVTSQADISRVTLGFELDKTLSYELPQGWSSFGKPPVKRDGEVVMRMKKLVNDSNGDFILLTFISPTEDAPIITASDQSTVLESLHRKGIEAELPKSLEGKYTAFRVDSGKNIGFVSMYTDKNITAALKKGEKIYLTRASLYLNPNLNRGLLSLVSFYTNDKAAIADGDFKTLLNSMQLN